VRELAPQLGLHVIDTPALFQRHLQGGMPDRRVFYDYCHLNADGLKVVLTATAMKLQSCLKNGADSETDIAKRFIRPSAALAARAAFLAALHNATWGQERQIIAYHLQNARQLDPQVARYAEVWAGVAGKKIDPVYTKAFSAGQSLGDKLFMFRLATVGPFLGRDLAEEMTSVFGGRVGVRIRET
jgi:hypothetical protein